MEEKSILPKMLIDLEVDGESRSYFVSNERFENSARHEVFFGTADRKKSIKYGLYVFLSHENHNMSNKGVHFCKEFNFELKRRSQEAAMKYYGWSLDDWMAIFHRNYL